jgi:hypothetical protein
MTTQDKRIRELTDRHTVVQGKMLFEEMLLAPKVIGTYFPAKIEHLKALLAILGGSEEGRAKAFADRIAEASKTNDSMLGAIYRDVDDPSLDALMFETQAHTEERRYFESLAALKLGEMRDELFGKITALKTFTDGLQRKWDETVVNNQSLLRVEKEATEEITRAVDVGVERAKLVTVGLQGLPAKIEDRFKEAKKAGEKAVTEVWNKYTGAEGLGEAVGKEAAYLAVDKAQSVLKGMVASQIPVVLDGVTKGQLEQVKECVDVQLQMMRVKAAAELGKYRQAMSQQTQGVAVLFSVTRKDTEEFARNNDFEAGKKIYQQMREALDRWIAGLPSDGLKGDAGEFAQACLDAVSVHLKRMEETFNDFVYRNRARFYGPVGPEIAEQLAQKESWRSHEDTLCGKGLETHLRYFRDASRRFLDYDINYVFERNSSIPDAMPAELKQAYATYLSGMRDLIIAEVKTLIGEVDRKAEETARELSDQKLREGLNRQELATRVSAG